MAPFLDPSVLNDTYILQLFNLQRESIESIAIAHKNNAMYVTIKLLRRQHPCPTCSCPTSVVKDYTQKKILHSLVSQTPCYILYQARRYVCKACGKTFYEHNPFSHRNRKISVLSVSNILQDLKKPTETFASVSERFHVSPTTVASVFDAHVSISRRTLPAYLCIDEVYAFHSSRSDYVCVLVDFEEKATIDLLPTRKKDDLIRYFELIPLSERKKVKIVASDMWETYRIVTKRMFPNACMALDKFHVLQEHSRKVTQIRLRAMHKATPKKLTKTQRDALSMEEKIIQEQKEQIYYVYKKFNWLLFVSDDAKESSSKTDSVEKGKTSKKERKLLDPNAVKKYNSRLKRYCNYYDLLDMMFQDNEQLKDAMNLKYRLDKFFQTCKQEDAKKELEKLIVAYSDSGMEELVSFAATLRKWKYEIINSFIIVDKTSNRKMNNGIIENRNKVIKQLKRNSNGYHNWSRFRNRALYVLNKDATYQLNPIEQKR